MLPGLLFPAGFGVGLRSSGDIILPLLFYRKITPSSLWNRHCETTLTSPLCLVP